MADSSGDEQLPKKASKRKKERSPEPPPTHDRRLEISVVEARNLTLVDPSSPRGPYVEMALGNRKARTQKTRSEANPTWRQDITLYVDNEYTALLLIGVWHGNKKHCIGKYTLNLGKMWETKRLENTVPVDLWLQLLQKAPDGSWAPETAQPALLHVNLTCYNFRRIDEEAEPPGALQPIRPVRSLQVKVVRGMNLQPGNSQGLMRPIVELVCDSQRHVTATGEAADHAWNEQFAFPLREDGPVQLSVCVRHAGQVEQGYVGKQVFVLTQLPRSQPVSLAVPLLYQDSAMQWIEKDSKVVLRLTAIGFGLCKDDVLRVEGAEEYVRQLIQSEEQSSYEFLLQRIHDLTHAPQAVVRATGTTVSDDDEEDIQNYPRPSTARVSHKPEAEVPVAAEVRQETEAGAAHEELDEEDDRLAEQHVQPTGSGVGAPQMHGGQPQRNDTPPQHLSRDLATSLHQTVMHAAPEEEQTEQEEPAIPVSAQPSVRSLPSVSEERNAEPGERCPSPPSAALMMLPSPPASPLPCASRSSSIRSAVAHYSVPHTPFEYALPPSRASEWGEQEDSAMADLARRVADATRDGLQQLEELQREAILTEQVLCRGAIVAGEEKARRWATKLEKSRLDYEKFLMDRLEAERGKLDLDIDSSDDLGLSMGGWDTSGLGSLPPITPNFPSPPKPAAQIPDPAASNLPSLSQSKQPRPPPVPEHSPSPRVYQAARALQYTPEPLPQLASPVNSGLSTPQHVVTRVFDELRRHPDVFSTPEGMPLPVSRPVSSIDESKLPSISAAVQNDPYRQNWKGIMSSQLEQLVQLDKQYETWRCDHPSLQPYHVGIQGSQLRSGSASGSPRKSPPMVAIDPFHKY
eukprot:TRINITY_DN5907_c0_g1_i1.p1 TRINITY_DN5907_c0_g1~~TRINITY_DN5907_c0_g1_i1.p1  ORF type:complete len:858 (-),score=121.07 TRINITY_DN5907_c0_g1_i1:28-2601(-)